MKGLFSRGMRKFRAEPCDFTEKIVSKYELPKKTESEQKTWKLTVCEGETSYFVKMSWNLEKKNLKRSDI